MVKLTGPHFSITALGKFGKVTVYSIWKGIQYARMLITPTNPKTGAQGDHRIILGGMGRSAKYVQSEKVFETFSKAVTPAGQSWISYYVDYIISTYMKTTTLYLVETAELAAHSAVTDWYAEALALGLTDFTLPYKDAVTGFGHGLMLYELAKFGCDQYLLDNTKFNAEPYQTVLASWDLAKIQLMVADFSA